MPPILRADATPEVAFLATCNPDLPRPSCPLAPFLFFYNSSALESIAFSRASGGFSGGGGALGGGGAGAGALGVLNMQIFNSLLVCHRLI